MRLSGGLPALRVNGNRIVDEGGSAVLLRGVNRSGMEYAPIGWPENEFDSILSEWGANIIRIPFNQDWALQREGYDAEPYLELLDRIVSFASARGAYVLLALQWLDNRTARGFHWNRVWKGRPNFVPPLPDELSLVLWRQLAARYRDESAILFDILTEPHDPLPGDPLRKHTRRVTKKEWRAWAEAIIREIRAEKPDALVFVSGLNWGYDLRGFPLPDETNVVYSTHVYRNKGGDWDESFGNLSRVAPVFAGEWGGEDTDIEWGLRLARYLEEQQIGWTAWGWPDYPPLIRDGYEPTPFGQLVRSLLRETESDNSGYSAEPQELD